MEELTEQQAEDAFARASHPHPGEGAESWRQLHLRQPALHAYIVDRSENRFEPEIAELLEQTAALIWRIFLQADEDLDRVTPRTIDDLERSNAPILQILSEETGLEGDFEHRFNLLMRRCGDLPPASPFSADLRAH